MGIELKKQCLYTFQFADDQAIIASNKEDMEYMMRKLMEEYEEWGSTPNTKYLQKTRYLHVSEQKEIDTGRK